ncbi:uncharacterized protein LOC144451686 [Glandiceps talaboti]
MTTEIDLAKDGDISYRLLTEDHMEEAATIISHAFINAEPLSSCVNQPFQAEQASNVSICQAVIKDGLSLVAIDNSTGKVVGTSTAALVTVADILKDLEGEMSESILAPPGSLPHYHPIVAVVQVLDSFLLQVEDFINNPDALVCSSAKVGVDGKYNGKGIATKLIELRTDLAKKKGCKFVIAQVTGPGSQKVYSNLGFKEIGEMKYKEFEYKGEKIYSAINICPSAKMVILKL